MGKYGQPIIAYQYFSYVSSECQLLFNDGHYYGCIALCQSLAEAYARFMCEKWITNSSSKNFKSNIQKIRREGIQPDVSHLLKDMYGEQQQRNDFHHLNDTVPMEYEELRSIATDKINLLNNIESQIFECENTKEGLKVKYPKYWDFTDRPYNAFIRIQH